MEWITINQFPKYEINILGQVRNKKSGKILSQSLSSKRYYQINIDNKSRRTHILLAETFIPNPDKLETVNHKNGSKIDNSLSNLEWMSRSDNVKHGREVLGIIPIPYSKSHKKNHLIGKKGIDSNAGKMIKATLSDNSERIFGSAYEAGRILFNDEIKGRAIRQSIRRKSKYFNIKFEEYEHNH